MVLLSPHGAHGLQALPGSGGTANHTQPWHMGRGCTVGGQSQGGWSRLRPERPVANRPVGTARATGVADLLVHVSSSCSMPRARPHGTLACRAHLTCFHTKVP